MSSFADYETYLKDRAQSYEAICRRCGACCGRFEEDPCANLRRDRDGKYTCGDYENRLGMQKTASGKEFKCVPVRNILFESWSGSWRCAYKRPVQVG